MKLYTRTGDRGTTALADGSRRPKDDARLEAYGTVDELNSSLGLLRALGGEGAVTADEWDSVQSILFDVGAALATPGDRLATGRPAPPQVEALEALVDRLTAMAEPMHCFVLPAGTAAACQAQVARTVCRRAERRIISLDHALEAAGEGRVAPVIIAYVNRLSDMLFALARALNAAAGVPDTPWRP